MSVRAALVSWVLDLIKLFGLVETSSLQAPVHTLISPFATPRILSLRAVGLFFLSASNKSGNSLNFPPCDQPRLFFVFLELLFLFNVIRPDSSILFLLKIFFFVPTNSSRLGESKHSQTKPKPNTHPSAQLA